VLVPDSYRLALHRPGLICPASAGHFLEFPFNFGAQGGAASRCLLWVKSGRDGVKS
jgi:hypothetical protein